MKQLKVVAGCGLLAAAVSIAFARGSLTPPAGPVEPTGRTLTEIYNRVGSAGGGGGAPATWSHAGFAFGTDGAFVPVVAGSGTLHRVVMSAPTADGSATMILRIDGQDIHRMRASVFASMELNIRFEQGVEIRRQGGGSDALLLYALD